MRLSFIELSLLSSHFCLPTSRQFDIASLTYFVLPLYKKKTFISEKKNKIMITQLQVKKELLSTLNMLIRSHLTNHCWHTNIY